ncbi:DUF3850 domain-containing protein [Photobacterium halotolerans]|uniref:DUF3850 domain-containing protein n=1 Tax=Photobacterium halotolerans TaxID=265726 RepID=A0A0F5VF90_9GAMM|nr:DUF3850 domain-containing protein [Photobacterium halotolerans]KKD00477.1 hypothetical protein KY46_07525 [Photobacterium halotolerans]
MSTVTFHELKIPSANFTDILAGRKTHQLCLNHRQYSVGDVLILRELDENGEETAQEMNSLITHVEYGNATGLEDGWCVLSLANTTPLLGIRLIGYLRDRLKEHCDYTEAAYQIIRKAGSTDTQAKRTVQAGRCWVDEANHFLKKFSVGQ